MSQERFEIPGPTRTVIRCGWDPGGLGFFLTVMTGGRRAVEYHAFDPCYDGLPGLLRALVGAQAVTEADVAEARRLLPHLVSLEVVRDARVRLVAEIVTRLRAAAAE